MTLFHNACLQRYVMQALRVHETVLEDVMIECLLSILVADDPPNADLIPAVGVRVNRTSPETCSSSSAAPTECKQSSK